MELDIAKDSITGIIELIEKTMGVKPTEMQAKKIVSGVGEYLEWLEIVEKDSYFDARNKLLKTISDRNVNV